MSTTDTSKIPNSLEEHWMPFTSNRDFKENPRLITEAKGVYLKNQCDKKCMQPEIELLKYYFVIEVF